MSKDKDNNQEIERIVNEECFRESISKEITSNTSETKGEIPPFTSGNSDSSGD